MLFKVPVMTWHAKIWLVGLAIFGLNIPFGYWRASVRKLSTQWFCAVHIPVPIAIGLRLLAGLAWRWATFPLFVGAFFGGQFIGGQLHKFQKRRELRISEESCQAFRK